MGVRCLGVAQRDAWGAMNGVVFRGKGDEGFLYLV